MNKLFIILLLFFALSCSNSNKLSMTTNLTTTKSTTSTIVTNQVNKSDCSMSYAFDGMNSKFKGNFSAVAKPTSKINIVLEFTRDDYKIHDTIETEKIARLLDFNDIDKIEIDSVKYSDEKADIKVRFIISLTKKETISTKNIDKYWMVYSSNFKNPQSKIALTKTEKSSIEVFEL